MLVLIVGASVRAAAYSALRAGLKPISTDLFADRDLTAICDSVRIDPADYPEGLAALSRNLPQCPWIYTGALENHPDLIDQIGADRPLWGVNGAALRAVRNPIALSESLSSRGLVTPETREDPQEVPRDGSWLTKPLHSAGGRSVSTWTNSSRLPTRPVYFQERITGQAVAAIFAGQEGQAKLLGITGQILGQGDHPYAYTGSIGPWPVSSATLAEIGAIGSALAADFGLKGLFGVDGVLRADGRFVVVEVNPRYTASVEVLELALGKSLLGEHLHAFSPRSDPVVNVRIGRQSFVGKKVLFAEFRSQLCTRDSWSARIPRGFTVPVVADVPQPGMIFEPGDPVLTVLARGSSLDSCRAKLDRRLARWRSRLVPAA